MVLDKAAQVFEGIAALAAKRVMVGIPADNTDRKDDGPITNAALGYIHENGAPEVNIPARPWLVPGVKSDQQNITDGLKVAGELALDGNPQGVERQFHRVGLRTSSAVKAYLNAGVAPPLAESTLRGRAARGRKGAKKELANRAAGGTASTELAKPLIDTAQMRNAVTYVVRTSGH